MSRILFKTSVMPDFLTKYARIEKVKGKKYYYLPYWFCKPPDEEWYEIFRLDDLPKELIEVLKQKRK